LRECAGFSYDEVELLQQAFDFYDRSRRYILSKEDIMRILRDADTFPSTTDLLQKLASSADQRVADGGRSLRFDDLLQLMLRAIELEQNRRVHTELRAKEACELSNEDFHEFRDVYQRLLAKDPGISVDLSGSLCPPSPVSRNPAQSKKSAIVAARARGSTLTRSTDGLTVFPVK